jgi:putative addiction module component (TIGR02574 family)
MNVVNQLLDRRSHSVDDSRMSLTSIQEEIVRLSSTERAMLIDILWESLDEERVKEIEAKWSAESEDRIDAVDRGELHTVDGPSALSDLRSSLRK